MKCIHMFIASSIVEFEKERNELGNYIRSLNDLYVDRDIYFKLTMCEDLSTSVELEGKQNFYNSKIRESDYFYIIFGKNAGEYTLQEFDVAMEQFRATGKPKIYTYFKQLPDGNVSDNVVSFMERLDGELGHYYSIFTHIDSIKLNILLELSRDPQIENQIEIENGNVCVNGENFLSLKNVPVYSKNEELNRYREEMQKLDAEFASAAAAYGQSPSSAKLMQEMMDIGHKRGKIADAIRQIEKDILELYTTVSRIKNENRPLNWWEKEASRLLDTGNSEGALQILRDVQLQKELEQAKSIAENATERMISVIRAKKMAILLLRTRGLTDQIVNEIKDNYNQIAEIAEKYHIEMDSLYDYASFLHDRYDFSAAEQLIDRLIAWYRYKGEKGKSYIDALTLQSIIFAKNENFEAAEKGFIELLNLYRETESSESTIKSYANVNNSLGMMFCTANRLEDAEKYALESVMTMRDLVEKNPTVDNRYSLANSCDTLVQIYDKVDRFEDAKKISAETYKISKELATENPKRFSSRYARFCAHYSMFHNSLEEFNQKESLLLEALNIFTKLSKESPNEFLPNVVWIMYLLGGLYYNINNEKAYKYYSEAYNILTNLPAFEQKNYTINTTMLCSSLAVLLIWRGETQKAEEMLLLVVKENEKLHAEHPDIYIYPLGDCYNNLMLFYSNNQKYKEAFDYGLKTKELVENAVKSTDDPHAKLLNLLATTYYNLANLYNTFRQPQQYEALVLQAAHIWGKLRTKYGQAYDRNYFSTSVPCAKIYEEKKDLAKAEEILTEAYEYFVKVGEPCYEISNISAGLTVFYLQRGELEKSEKMQRTVLEIIRRGYLADKRTFTSPYAQAHNNLAATLSRRQDANEKSEEICDLYKAAMQLFMESCESGDTASARFLMFTYSNLSKLYKSKKDIEKVVDLQQKMIELLTLCSKSNPDVYEPNLATVYYNLANIVSNILKDTAKGRELLLKALEIAKKYPQAKQFAEQIEQILKNQF